MSELQLNMVGDGPQLHLPVWVGIASSVPVLPDASISNLENQTHPKGKEPSTQIIMVSISNPKSYLL